MTSAARRLLVAIALAGGIASVQGANDPATPRRACAPMEGADRVACPDGPSPAAAPPLRQARAGDGWVISETTSPVDYSPIATATTASRNVADGGEAMRLSIRCRGGRTELTVAGTAVTGRGDDYFLSYRVNGGRSVQSAGSAPAFGDGVAFKGDIVALLQSLPAEGEFFVRVFALSGKALDAIFSLDGLEVMRAKIGATCRWPHAMAKPNDRSSRF
ncbi:MAG TPA: hypothetical protein VMM15_12080 [Bradyrhizobium sp.]|nr:hypothetical protein [Bradyrhizobium sp.]